MGEGRVRIKLDPAFELGLGGGPIPVEPQLDVPEGHVRFAQRGIELHRSHGRGLRFRDRFDPERPEKQVGVGETRIRHGVLGVFGDRLLQVFDRFLVAVDRSLIPVVASLQIELIRFGIFGLPPHRPFLFLARYADPKRLENLGRDFLLHCENIGHRPVVLPAPQLRAVRHVDQIRLDDQDIPARADATGNDGADIEVASR